MSKMIRLSVIFLSQVEHSCSRCLLHCSGMAQTVFKGWEGIGKSEVKGYDVPNCMCKVSE